MSDIQITESLVRYEVDAVEALAEAAHAYDGVAPLSEQTLLRARHGSPTTRIRFLLLWEEAEPTAPPDAAPRPSRAAGSRELAGFAAVEFPPSGGMAASGELVVSPERRGRGYGDRLLSALRTEAAATGLRLWAHGHLPAARALAGRHGMARVRGLWKMRMRLTPELRLPAPESVLRSDTAAQLDFRTFVVGQDEAAWLATNGRAFADHPEQGAVTLDDLLQREAEDWFDPDGFFLAEERATGRVAGFHWTKVHSDGAGLTDGEPVGEVYVVGVDPDWQGTGLGRALTIQGVRYLRDRELPWVLLYVDEDNRAAVRLYESLGFALWDADVMYESSGSFRERG